MRDILDRLPNWAVLVMLPCGTWMASTPEVRAQEDVVVSSAVECPACELQLTRTLSLGTPEAGLLGAEPSSVRRDSAGNFYLTQYNYDSDILVFAPSGTFKQVVGREGEGPGEFKNVRSIDLRADSIYAFDNGNARLSVFSPELSFVRSAPLPTTFVQHGAILPSGNIVTNATVSSPEAIGLPLHVISPEGDLISSFGSDGAMAPGGLGIQRRIATSSSLRGGLWSAHRTQYTIQLWDHDGNHRTTIFREAD